MVDFDDDIREEDRDKHRPNEGRRDGVPYPSIMVPIQMHGIFSTQYTTASFSTWKHSVKITAGGWLPCHEKRTNRRQYMRKNIALRFRAGH